MKARVEEAALLEKAETVLFAARLRGEKAAQQALLDYTSEKYQLVKSFHQNMSQIEFDGNLFPFATHLIVGTLFKHTI